jgi:predicted membrane GTPase involved in stress response
MAPALKSENNEPEDIGPIAIELTVPEEFLGFSIDALTTRQGTINNLLSQNGRAVIEASLPARQYESLEKAIVEYAGRDQCSVKLADGLAETDN